MSISITTTDQYPAIDWQEEIELSRLSAAASRFAAFIWHVSECEGRHDWSPEDWVRRLSGIAFYVAYTGGEPVGCFELALEEQSVCLNGFALAPEYRGSGLEAGFAVLAVDKAVSMGRDQVDVTGGVAPDLLDALVTQGLSNRPQVQ